MGLSFRIASSGVGAGHLAGHVVRAVRGVAVIAGSGILATAVATAPLAAQVGHRPEQSPFVDVRPTHNLSVTAGWLAVSRDPAGVAIKPAPLYGLRYDINVGGPASLYTRYLLSRSERDQLQPGVPVAERVVGSRASSIHMVDGGLDVSLTGRKTWRRLMPSAVAGAGVMSDFAGADSGGYKFGTKFVLHYGGAMRIIPESGPSFRIDLQNHLWQYQFPERYFAQATDGSAILSDTRARSSWRGNWALSVGATIRLSR